MVGRPVPDVFLIADLVVVFRHSAFLCSNDGLRCTFNSLAAISCHRVIRRMEFNQAAVSTGEFLFKALEL